MLKKRNSIVNLIFHVNGSSRFQIDMDNSVAGYCKILSALLLANKSCKQLSLHKQ